MTQPQSAAEVDAAQAVEYGTYVAAYPINHDGVRAYQRGEAVPVSNVEAYGYLESGQVVLRDSAEGRAILDDPTPPNGPQPVEPNPIEQDPPTEAPAAAAKPKTEKPTTGTSTEKG